MRKRAMLWMCMYVYVISGNLPADAVVLRTSGIFDENGALVRQWEVGETNRHAVAAWDGLDDAGKPVSAGTYTWKSVEWNAKALRSRWVTAIGAHPARNDAGAPVYFPGAIVGASTLEQDLSGEKLYIGAPVGDASDILMQTDRDITRMHWNVTLYQPSLHAVHAMRRGGADLDTLFILQAPHRVHLFDREGQELTVHQIPPSTSDKGSPQLAVNETHLAVSYPDEDLVRIWLLPNMEVVRTVSVPVPQSLAFKNQTGSELLIVSLDKRQILQSDTEGALALFNDSVPWPGMVRRVDGGFLVSDVPGQYLLRADPDGHGQNAERMIPEQGATLVLLDANGAPVQTYGSGRSNYDGPWYKGNLNGILDAVANAHQILILDWPNRIVYVDREDGTILREVFLGEGSYFTVPAYDVADPDRLYVRGMYNRYIWQYRIDPARGTWDVERLIYNTAASLGATQSFYPRVYSREGHRLLLMERFKIAALDDNRTWPVLRTRVDAASSEDQIYYLQNAGMQPDTAAVVPRPSTGVSDVDTGGIIAIDPQRNVLVLNHLFSSTLALLPIRWGESGAPEPIWDQARVWADFAPEMPNLDLYQHMTGVFDAQGHYFGTFSDRNVNVQREKDHHLYWPGVESAHSVLYSYDLQGRRRFKVHGTQVQRLQYRGFVQGIISDVVEDWVFVTDRARPGQQVYTRDGLFAGNTWYYNRPEEVPHTLQDPYTRADIMKGSVFRWRDGKMYHAQANINRVDLYEILGLETMVHDRGEIVLKEAVAPAKAKGRGLAAVFYADRDMTVEVKRKAETRVRYHNNPNMFDHTWLRWPENTKAARWHGVLEVPVTAAYVFDCRVGGATDGITVWLNGEKIIGPVAGTDPLYVKARSMRLERGMYPIEIHYVHRVGDQAMGLNWQTPLWNRSSIPVKYLYAAP